MRKQNTVSRILGLASLVGVVALGACGGSGGAKDMAVKPVPDMTATNGTGNCASIIQCVTENCTTDATCIANCINMGTTTAQNTFNAITGCGLNICTVATSTDGGDADGGGAAACSSVNDTTPACVSCATDAAKSPACSSFIGACENS